MSQLCCECLKVYLVLESCQVFDHVFLLYMYFIAFNIMATGLLINTSLLANSHVVYEIVVSPLMTNTINWTLCIFSFAPL